MKVKVCDEPKQVRTHLLKLLDECQRFSWASAWVTSNSVVDAALEAKEKLAYLVIGTQGYITSPEVLEACLGLKQVRVYPPDAKTLFHPKVYAFEMEDRLEVYIGSSNLTGAGLSKNRECGVFLSAEADHPQLEELLFYVDECWGKGQVLKRGFIDSYIANKKRVKAAQEALAEFTPLKPKISTKHTANHSAGQTMEWDEFVRLVKQFKNQSVDQRLSMLSVTRDLAAQRFDALSLEDRKKVSGRLKGIRKDGNDYGWFGQMLASGRFSPAINAYAGKIADALDCIPLTEEVKHRDYEAFRKAFLKVPTASNGWLGFGTRLLAMRRPDQFVCLDRPNIRGVSAAFGAHYSTVNLENYWDNIISQIRLAPWYLSNEPRGKEERALWNGRVAFLDAIYYDPLYRK